MSVDRYYGNNQISVYPNIQATNDCFRFSDKSNNVCERTLFNNYWQEQIQLFGQRADYYVHNYSTLSADNLYGEDTLQSFSPPLPIIIAVNLNENALMLSKYGLIGDDELTAFIPITGFYDVFGYGKEPKAGDVFNLVEYGSDRPGDRSGKYFEVTERMDQEVSQINPLMGHYVWMIKAKRFQYSFERGLSGETVNQQVFDDTKTDGVSGATKPYTYSADVSGKEIFDYTGKSYTDIYGGY